MSGNEEFEDLRDKSRFLELADKKLLEQVKKDPIGSLLMLCVTLLVSVGAGLGSKIVAGNIHYPDDLPSVIIFGIAVFLFLGIVYVHNIMKLKEREAKISSMIKLERHREEMRAKERFRELSGAMVDVLGVGDVERVQCLASVAAFLTIQDKNYVEEKITILSNKLEEIDQSIRDLQKLSGKTNGSNSRKR